LQGGWGYWYGHKSTNIHELRSGFRTFVDPFVSDPYDIDIIKYVLSQTPPADGRVVLQAGSPLFLAMAGSSSARFLAAVLLAMNGVDGWGRKIMTEV
jgi:hypothetical protein